MDDAGLLDDLEDVVLIGAITACTVVAARLYKKHLRATRVKRLKNKYYKYRYRVPFPYHRQTFNLDTWADERVRRLLRFNKEEIKFLAEAFNLRDVSYRFRVKPHPVTALCVVLYRLSWPHRLVEACDQFGRSESWISTVFNDVTTFLDTKYSETLRWHPLLNDYARLKRYAKAVYDAGGQGQRKIWGFIDGTFCGFCRSVDSEHQQRMYSGYYKGHGMKWQAIVTPDGLVSSLCGPWPGPTNDWTMLNESKIMEEFRHLFRDQERLYVYGDPAYGHDIGIMGPYRHPNGQHGLAEDDHAFNTALASVRIAVEHAFGHIAQQWTFTSFAHKMQEGLSPVGCYFTTSVLLINCFKCFRGSQTSERFVCKPPSIHEYLGIPNQAEVEGRNG